MNVSNHDNIIQHNAKKTQQVMTNSAVSKVTNKYKSVQMNREGKAHQQVGRTSRDQLLITLYN